MKTTTTTTTETTTTTIKALVSNINAHEKMLAYINRNTVIVCVFDGEYTTTDGYLLDCLDRFNVRCKNGNVYVKNDYTVYVWYSTTDRIKMVKFLTALYYQYDKADRFAVLFYPEKKTSKIADTFFCRRFIPIEFFGLLTKASKLDLCNDPEKGFRASLKLRLTDKIIKMYDFPLFYFKYTVPRKQYEFITTDLANNYDRPLNNGEKWEMFVSYCENVQYTPNNTPFFEGADVTTHTGLKIQCKAPRATLCDIATLKNLI